ncbi:hypothetical protein AFV6_gp54 [Betalipothrixvirus pozzuoliense]|uniref:Uncharacterized protein n=1 Tax=Betalipothrixvirus pozzuoliense TaxID=346882 RepID=A7WKK8_9VIRU|nr:hypothetical protein AFV6_gp54 [Acidianus filamentous virus 6]CAJ31608.1 conserved hypothetical protein [Acidianus filamentous virus 6]
MLIMGIQIAWYNVCNPIETGIFSASGGSVGASYSGYVGDPCGNCGYGLAFTTGESATATATITVTVPYSELVYNPENVWVVVIGSLYYIGSSSLPSSATFTIALNFLNTSGSSIGSYSYSVSLSAGSGTYYMIAVPVPSGTASIEISVTIPYYGFASIGDVAFFSQPITYYIEPLYFYNQSLSYSVTVNYSESGYVSIMSVSGGPSDLTSYSVTATLNSGSITATNISMTSVSELDSVTFTGTANNDYQITWSQVIAIPYANSSCQISQIFVFNVTGYNNILNPQEYVFSVQTPFNGSIQKTYTLLVPVGYFKIIPSYSLSCSTTPCTSGFTTFTITIDIETSSGVVVASQQVNVLEGQTFAEFNLEDYYGGQTLNVVVTLDINASLSQQVTLTINFEYEVQAQT